MTSDTADQLVAAYLHRLASAAMQLPAAHRAELVDEIREHIASARHAGPAGEAATRTVLDRLGSPEDIVAAAREGEPGPVLPPVGPMRKPVAALEIWSVVLLTIGSCVPIVGWTTGVVLLWCSRRWRIREKLLGTLVSPGGPGLALLLLVTLPTRVCQTGPATPEMVGTDSDGVVHVIQSAGPARTSCTGFALPPAAGIPLLVFMVIGPLVVGGLLLSAALRRAEQEPWVPDLTASRWGRLEVAALVMLGPGAVLLPVVAPLVGLLLTWLSHAWSTVEKSVATALTVAPILFLVLFLL
jgi:HAAS domain-containing protein